MMMNLEWHWVPIPFILSNSVCLVFDRCKVEPGTERQTGLVIVDGGKGVRPLFSDMGASLM